MGNGDSYQLKPHQQAALHNYLSPSEATEWVAEYAARLSRLLDLWQLRILSQLDAGFATNSIFYVEDVSGRDLVLKLGPGLETEIIAYQAFSASHIVDLVEYSIIERAALMPRLDPGTDLRGHLATCNKNGREQVLKRVLPLLGDVSILAHPDSGLPRFSDWIEEAFLAFRQTNSEDLLQENISLNAYLDRAEILFAQVTAESPDFILHGDLHHENILLDESGGWCVIDPKGVIGPRLLDMGRFLHNFMEDEYRPDEPRYAVAQIRTSALSEIFITRIRLAAAVLEFSELQLMQAAFIDVVLATCWTFNAEGEAPDGMQRIRCIDRCLKDLCLTDLC